MKACLIALSFLITCLMNASAQTHQQKARPNNFVYMLSDQAPGTDSLKLLDSLTHISSRFELIRFVMYGGSETNIRYDLIYPDADKWIYEYGANKIRQKNALPVLLGSTLSADSAIIDNHGVYFHTGASASNDKYGYYLVKDGKIVQSLMCETPYKDIDNKDLLERMRVFGVLDKVKPKL
jgi:hypothetical protein